MLFRSAFIVKGLIALLLRLYANRRPQDILDNPPAVFEQIGLGAHLSPTRANGLHESRSIGTARADSRGPRGL